MHPNTLAACIGLAAARIGFGCYNLKPLPERTTHLELVGWCSVGVQAGPHLCALLRPCCALVIPLWVPLWSEA